METMNPVLLAVFAYAFVTIAWAFALLAAKEAGYLVLAYLRWKEEKKPREKSN